MTDIQELISNLSLSHDSRIRDPNLHVLQSENSPMAPANPTGQHLELQVGSAPCKRRDLQDCGGTARLSWSNTAEHGTELSRVFTPKLSKKTTTSSTTYEPLSLSLAPAWLTGMSPRRSSLLIDFPTFDDNI